jgi:MFS family permease
MPRDVPQEIGSPGSRKWWILSVLCISVLLVAIDNTIVNVALPTLNRRINASTADLQWIVTAYSLLFAGLLLVAGHLGDRMGRKRILQIGLVLFALTSLAAARSASVDQLILARAGMGVAAAMIYPSTLALLSSTFTDRKQAELTDAAEALLDRPRTFIWCRLAVSCSTS